MSRTIVRTEGLGEGVLSGVALTQHGWLIALSTDIVEDGPEEHLVLAAAEKSIGLLMMGFRQPEGGVDIIDMGPRVDGPRLVALPPEPHRYWDRLTRGAVVAAAFAPLTALAWVVAHANAAALPGITS